MPTPKNYFCVSFITTHWQIALKFMWYHHCSIYSNLTALTTSATLLMWPVEQQRYCINFSYAYIHAVLTSLLHRWYAVQNTDSSQLVIFYYCLPYSSYNNSSWTSVTTIWGCSVSRLYRNQLGNKVTYTSDPTESIT